MISPHELSINSLVWWTADPSNPILAEVINVSYESIAVEIKGEKHEGQSWHPVELSVELLHRLGFVPGENKDEQIWTTGNAHASIAVHLAELELGAYWRMDVFSTSGNFRDHTFIKAEIGTVHRLQALFFLLAAGMLPVELLLE